jgi:hypothetical protein
MTLKNSIVFAQAYTIARQTVNFATSNYSNLTGDMIGQQTINAGMSLLGSAVNIGGSLLVNPGLAVIAMITEATKTGFSAVQREINVANRNAQISLYRERIGRVIERGGR